ncbi:MAG: hypothetical protein NW216_01255 [Hyphomicrobium sp.]|nr:hypothetical protein [Hyphomicrobium sp.]
MTIDGVLRAIGALACIYTVALFVSVMSTAALQSAAFSGNAVCSDRQCTALSMADHTHHASPVSTTATTLHVAAMFFADPFQ